MNNNFEEGCLIAVGIAGVVMVIGLYFGYFRSPSPASTDFDPTPSMTVKSPQGAKPEATAADCITRDKATGQLKTSPSACLGTAVVALIPDGWELQRHSTTKKWRVCSKSNEYLCTTPSIELDEAIRRGREDADWEAKLKAEKLGRWEKQK